MSRHESAPAEGGCVPPHSRVINPSPGAVLHERGCPVAWRAMAAAYRELQIKPNGRGAGLATGKPLPHKEARLLLSLGCPRAGWR
jgi:hypothetical protein